MQATAASYVISPAALAAVEPDPERAPDRLSAFWMLALAARLVRDVGSLLIGARKAGKRIATFALDGEVRFASAADRSAFAEELSHAVAALVAKYHDDTAAGGRSHRIVVAIHPSVPAATAATSMSPPRRRPSSRRSPEMAHPFEVSGELTVNATARAGLGGARPAAPRMDGWWMGENELEPRLGGALRTTLPGFTMESTITTWDPPHRFATTSPEADDGRLMTFAFEIEGRAGGTTTLRFVHSGFLPGDDWEQEYEALKIGDPAYVAKLVEYVEHFLGRPAVPISAVGTAGQQRARLAGVHGRARGRARAGGRRSGPLPGRGAARSRRRDRLRLARLHRPPDRRRDVPLHPRDGDDRDRPPPLRARRPGGDRAGLAGLDRPHVRLIRPEPTRNTERRPRHDDHRHPPDGHLAGRHDARRRHLGRRPGHRPRQRRLGRPRLECRPGGRARRRTSPSTTTTVAAAATAATRRRTRSSARSRTSRRVIALAGGHAHLYG